MLALIDKPYGDRRRRQRLTAIRAAGFTLVEVLVAVVVLAIGILGVAALQTTSMTQGHGSMQASQATSLAYDMADRIRGNSALAYKGDYDFNTVSGSPPTNSGGTCFVSTGAGSGCNIAMYDQYQWYTLVQQQLSGAKVIVACADGHHCLQDPTPQTILITIYWNENGSNTQNTTTPLTAANCGTSTYDATADLPCVILALQP